MGWAKFSLTTVMWSPVEPFKSLELTHLRKQLTDFAWICSTMDPWETVNMLVPKQHSWWVSISIMGRRCQSDCWFMSRNCRSHIRRFSKSLTQNTSILECGSVWNTGNFRASLCHWNILEYKIVPLGMITSHMDSQRFIIRYHSESCWNASVGVWVNFGWDGMSRISCEISFGMSRMFTCRCPSQIGGEMTAMWDWKWLKTPHAPMFGRLKSAVLIMSMSWNICILLLFYVVWVCGWCMPIVSRC